MKNNFLFSSLWNLSNMSRIHFILPIFLLLALLHLAPAADITITAKGTPANKQSLSLSTLRSDNSEHSQEFIRVLKGDLIRSGYFTLVDSPSAAIVLDGYIQGQNGLTASANAKWFNGMRQFTWKKIAPAEKTRDTAHALCDHILNEILQKPSMASSKILCVGRRNGPSEVYQCDADGGRLQQLTSDGKLCLSPTWVPNQNAFLYTSWLSGPSAIYQVNLNTKRREKIASFPGMNNGAVISPNGAYMALVLSRSGGVDLYVQNLATRKLNRLTQSNKINESSPTWAPNGNALAYISDEGRVPRLYIMDVNSRQGRRATYFSGITECAAPEWGENNLITFCARSAGRYRIYTLNPNEDSRTSTPQAISPPDAADYEDPSWAPDGRHIVCTRSYRFKRSLVVLDTLGDPPQPLFTIPGDWYVPHWSKQSASR